MATVHRNGSKVITLLLKVADECVLTINVISLTYKDSLARCWRAKHAYLGSVSLQLRDQLLVNRIEVSSHYKYILL